MNSQPLAHRADLRTDLEVQERVELTRSELARGAVGHGALLPYRSEREGQPTVGYESLAEPYGNARSLRTAVIHLAIFSGLLASQR